MKSPVSFITLIAGIVSMGLMTSHTANATMPKDAKIYVAGHRGLVGSAIIRQLHKEGYTNIIMRTPEELDLRSQRATNEFFEQNKPDYVFLAAAKVGGIKANWQSPANFIYDNLTIETNVVHAAYKNGVKKLIFLGSSCIYPRDCPQPIREEYLMTGPLETTNDCYALAKIAGIKMCQAYNKQYGTNYISVMPTNLYGINDNFDLETSHVLPAMIAKFYRATKEHKEFVPLWGTGAAFREFLFVDDLADAVIFLMNNYDGSEIVNIGTGEDITIRDLAYLIKDITGFEGDIVFDKRNPDGTPRKLLNVDRLKNMGWAAKTSLRDGIKQTLSWCTQNHILD